MTKPYRRNDYSTFDVDKLADPAVKDVDENEIDMMNTQIKINPDFYIHYAIIKAQFALTMPDMRDGFMRYRIVVEHIETLQRAAGMVTEDYDQEVESFRQTPKYSAEKDELIRHILLANKKLELLMTNLFNKKTITSPMKL